MYVCTVCMWRYLIATRSPHRDRVVAVPAAKIVANCATSEGGTAHCPAPCEPTLPYIHKYIHIYTHLHDTTESYHCIYKQCKTNVTKYFLKNA